jgi:hypothetical protein
VAVPTAEATAPSGLMPAAKTTTVPAAARPAAEAAAMPAAETTTVPAARATTVPGAGPVGARCRPGVDAPRHPGKSGTGVAEMSNRRAHSDACEPASHVTAIPPTRPHGGADPSPRPTAGIAGAGPGLSARASIGVIVAPPVIVVPPPIYVAPPPIVAGLPYICPPPIAAAPPPVAAPSAPAIAPPPVGPLLGATGAATDRGPAAPRNRRCGGAATQAAPSP